jgi:hypothetical protein
VRLQKGGNFREQSFGEHVDIVNFLKQGKIDEACTLLRSHILVINDSLDVLMNVQNTNPRAKRNYFQVFNGTEKRAETKSSR